MWYRSWGQVRYATEVGEGLYHQKHTDQELLSARFALIGQYSDFEEGGAVRSPQLHLTMTALARDARNVKRGESDYSERLLLRADP